MVSEFETVEQETGYDRWLRARVAASLADDQPTIAHDRVMAELDEMLEGFARKLA